MTQAQALQILQMGHSVFLTGEPGAGKTHVLRQFIAFLKQNKIKHGVTATTGIAATHLGGMTIHSFSGLGLRGKIDDSELSDFANKPTLNKRLNDLQVLIIDEISMLDADRFDSIDKILKTIRGNDKPFGGIQIVLSGDLFQLPPISRKDQPKAKFVFQSEAWKQSRFKVCYITEQHRTEEDNLLKILRKIRAGEAGFDELDELQTRQTDDIDGDITKLFTHNIDVDTINQQKLDDLSDESVQFEAQTSGNAMGVKSLTASAMVLENLELKIGAEIMTVVNNPVAGYVNGSRGRVVGFDELSNEPIIALHDRKKPLVLSRYTWEINEGQRTVAEFSQYPLRLAWAITIHKSQGMSLDEAEIDLSRSFEAGMGYVALSRLRGLEGLYLRGINEFALAVAPEVIDIDEQLRKNSKQIIKAIEILDDKQIDIIIKANIARRGTIDTAEDYDEGTYQQLREWRTKKATRNKMPSYIVLADKTLKEIAHHQPKNEKELAKIKGIGPQKLEDYGKEICDILTTNREKQSK